MRLHVVLWDALAVLVHDRQVGLRPGVSLVGCEPVPAHRFDVVLRDTTHAVVVPEPKGKLRRCVSLTRRQPQPPHRLGIVLRDASTGVVPDPEVVLRVGITGFRQSLQLLKHFLRTVRLWFSHDAVAVDPGPTAGWRAVQCEELRLTRVRGVPLASVLVYCAGPVTRTRQVAAVTRSMTVVSACAVGVRSDGGGSKSTLAVRRQIDVDQMRV